MPASKYDKWPATRMGTSHRLWSGQAAWAEIRRVAESRSAAPTVVVDCYPGTDIHTLHKELGIAFAGYTVIDVEEEAARPTAEIDAMIDQNLTDDRVFGVMSHLRLASFYREDRLKEIACIAAQGPTVIVGWGAALAAPSPDVLALADLARWEIQQRQRKGLPNWRSTNFDEDNLRKYKRGFFIEWRVADRHKQRLFSKLDFVIDTNASTTEAKVITGDTFREGLAITAAKPFRVVPFFDPGVWGGQWMKDVCALNDDQENYAWCFDCVPEENSLLLEVEGEHFELPSIDLVFRHPRELLGELTFARFGAEFPIRFDFLDTMQGGNLSLQVHPLTEYIKDTFGMNYTQDESYYLLDAAKDAVVYLGVKDSTDPDEMVSALETASTGSESFDAEKYVNMYPAKKHDHFLIPAGTVHCSGADSMVLEISATPYIFTFKMWDWDRVGLDGIPRPIHLEHAKKNIQWDRGTKWTTENLVDQVQVIEEGDGWVEERTGLHEFEFIETRRHWFTKPVLHDTQGTVNVINLVEGSEAIVESPTGAFEPFIVHYAETFIVPARVGQYIIRPHGQGEGQKLGTLKASVRGTERPGFGK
ncbi:class I mannose-6-phosphate isomerase [Arthrobacter sp. NPDC058127]|uniref:class I mannose-6-phosphate isomerase n=1 Tax=Arthrobacter sp. NPDC058127 TaxID=3346351 RepID=UPI0036F0D1D2